MWQAYGYWSCREKSGFVDLSTTVASIANAPLREAGGRVSNVRRIPLKHDLAPTVGDLGHTREGFGDIRNAEV